MFFSICLWPMSILLLDDTQAGQLCHTEVNTPCSWLDLPRAGVQDRPACSKGPILTRFDQYCNYAKSLSGGNELQVAMSLVHKSQSFCFSVCHKKKFVMFLGLPRFARDESFLGGLHGLFGSMVLACVLAVMNNKLERRPFPFLS